MNDQDVAGCTSLAQVSLGDGVTEISYQGFRRCIALTNITIPRNVSTIGGEVFGYCTALRGIEVDSANQFFVSVDGVVLDKGLSTLVAFPAGRKGAYKALDSVTTVAYGAFAGSVGLSTITLPAGLTNLDTHAVFGCSNLTGIFFEGNAPTLGSSVFQGDTNATVYYLPGTSGWGPTFGGLPTVMLSPPLMLQQLIFHADESGLARSFMASLVSALASLERGNSIAVANQLQAFQKKVNAQVARSNPALAQALIQEAQDAIVAIQCKSMPKNPGTAESAYVLGQNAGRLSLHP